MIRKVFHIGLPTARRRGDAAFEKGERARGGLQSGGPRVVPVPNAARARSVPAIGNGRPEVRAGSVTAAGNGQPAACAAGGLSAVKGSPLGGALALGDAKSSRTSTDAHASIRAALFAVVASVLTATAGAASSTTELRAVRVATGPGGTQVTLDLSGSTGEKLFRLDHPQRAVLDLSRTHLRRGMRLPLGAGVVSGFRVGPQPGGTLRFVMQLSASTPTHVAWTVAPGTMSRQLVITLGDAPAAVAPPAIAAAEIDTAPRVVRAAHAPIDSGRDVIVAVDAGHGGQDPGAIGHGGTREKDVTLAVARALAERIDAEPGMRAVLTRNRDEFVVLRDRIGRARLAKADMFVSIHADSIANRDVSGASVYVLSEHGATNEAARWLADRENAADLMGGVKLDDKDKALASVLLDLSQNANISASMTAAQRVLGSLDAVGQVRKSQVQQAGFVVLKSPDIPSMLVETAYISNPLEEQNLRNSRHQAALAEAIFGGLRQYFAANPPSGTRFAQSRRSTVASVLAAPSADASVGRAP